jgi:transposase
MEMHKSLLSKEKQEELMEHFVSGSTARCASELVNVNKNTAAYFFHRFREVIYQATEEEAPFSVEIEVDESYFGGVCKGKRGRGTAGKVPVFGLLKRGGRVYAKVIPDTKSKTLMGITPITFWMFQSLNITGLITQNCLLTKKIILMELKIFGTRPKDICVDLTVFPSSIFLCF